MTQSEEGEVDLALDREKRRLEIEVIRRSLLPWYRKPSTVLAGSVALLAFLTVFANWRIASLNLGKMQDKADSLKADLKASEAAKQSKHEEVAALEDQVRELERKKDDLAAAILRQQPPTPELIADAKQDLRDSYVRKRAELARHQALLNRYMDETGGFNPPPSHMLSDVEEYEREVRAMEEAWPWLVTDAGSQTRSDR